MEVWNVENIKVKRKPEEFPLYVSISHYSVVGVHHPRSQHTGGGLLAALFTLILTGGHLKRTMKTMNW